jgi:hypothetical protein
MAIRPAKKPIKKAGAAGRRPRANPWVVPAPLGPLLPDPGSVAIRDEFVKRIADDLLGPAGGPTERFLARGGATRVRDRYLVGMLAPKDTVAFTENTSDDEGVDGESGEGDAAFPERPRGGAASLFPNSIGISVVADDTCSMLSVVAEWGRYRKESEKDEEGKSLPYWQRSPRRHTLQLSTKEGLFNEEIDPAGQPGVFLRGRMERIGSGVTCWLITVFLVNEQPIPLQNKDEAWLFQVGFSLEDAAGRPVFVGREEALGRPKVPIEDRYEVETLDMEYRDVVEFGIGLGTSVHCTPSAANPQRSVKISTATIPRFEVARTDAPDPKTVPQLLGLVVDMKELAQMDRSYLAKALAPLSDGYREWLVTEQRPRIGDASQRLTGHEAIANSVLDEAEQIADSIQRGIDLLLTDDDALDAFRFANRVMWQQRLHSIAGTQRLDASRTGRPPRLRDLLAAEDVPGNRSWRPFQLAFLLLNIPSLMDPAHEERTKPGLIDLLYFPTGGGKTEAYLGLVAFVFAIRRLQGQLIADDGTVFDGTAGLAVFMRYTLRLLTAQQVQRAAALVCAAEQERLRLAVTDPRWAKGDPFRLGMWVGGTVTPNRIDDASASIRDAHDRGTARGSTPKQLVACPWCGTKIGALNLDEDTDTHRSLLYCTDTTGDCPFTAAKAPGEGIPLVTVDDDIYRVLPSFLIATVDKFAQLPWEGRARMLFGQVEKRCSRHGFRHPDHDKRIGCNADTHPARAGRPGAGTTPVDRLRPPDLILQDELHLIAGPLGTMVGIYETAIDRLATWQVHGVASRPKVVASTATIRRARDQGHALFWRKTRVFPPAVLDAGKQFFAEQTPISTAPGRLYLGICARGVRLKQVQVRVFTAVMGAAWALWNRYGDAADPYLTAIGYFNALRELAGMRRMADDELRIQLGRAALWSPSIDRRHRMKVEELTSRVQSSDIPEALDRLAVSFDPAIADAEPIDLLLATNMLSVGVDIPRLGTMLVVGQPKATAEYIQATSRVGRDKDKPGVIVTLYNWARPRDVSHYERFEHYHGTFYRRVEPLSVTPFSPRALDRALTAVVVSEVRHLAGGANSNAAAATFDRFSPVATEIIAGIAERAVEVTGDASIRSSIEQEIKKRYDRWQTEQTATGGLLTFRRVPGGGQTYLLRRPEEDARWVQWTCPNSLRETEPNVNLIVERHKRNSAWVSEPPFGAPVLPGAHAGAADSGNGALDAEGADLDDLPADPDDEAISVADSEALS